MVLEEAMISVFHKACGDGDDIGAVAFPNRKSIIFDNKLDFSGTKLAES